MRQSQFHIVKTNRKEKFWFHNIRAVNYFCYRYWWLVLFAFLLYLLLWYWFCFRVPIITSCSTNQVFSQTVDKISRNVDSCCNCNRLPPPPSCPDRMLVFQVCNSNRERDDNFSVFFNGINIGNLNLNTNDQVGSVFIATTDNSVKITDPDFICPMSKMNVYYFNPSLVRYGENIIELRNIKNNYNNNFGTIEIRNYLKSDNNLISPCKVQNLEYKGNDGMSFTKKFNYTKCCE